MLVLSRGHNDKVIFPTLGISVEILRVAGNKVRLGIEAPEEIPVHRHEVCERIQAGGETDEIIKFPVSARSPFKATESQYAQPAQCRGARPSLAAPKA